MKLPLNFRQAEIEKLLQWAAAGESAIIVGVSGVGKSNLFNHLLDPNVHLQQLKERVGDILFIRINFHYALDLTDRTVYSLILDAIERHADLGQSAQLSGEVTTAIAQFHDQMLAASNDPLRTLHIFRRALRYLFQYIDKLILLCDQFDDVYQNANQPLFTTLRGLRESHKYRLAYFLFMRDPLDRLVVIPDPAREEFDELFTSKLLPLRAYNEEDALTLCNRIANRLRIPFIKESEFSVLYQLTGGHAGLLRAVLLAMLEDKISLAGDPVKICMQLLANKGMAYECNKFWHSLSIAEKRGLWTVAHNQESLTDGEDAVSLLKLKGLTKSAGSALEIFAPIFYHYIINTEHPWLKSIELDKRKREVWIGGRLAAKLHRPKEFLVFQKLYKDMGTVVTREELMEVGWPENKSSDSSFLDQALASVIFRLRQQIETNSSEPVYIITERGHGYLLNG